MEHDGAFDLFAGADSKAATFFNLYAALLPERRNAARAAYAARTDVNKSPAPRYGARLSSEE
jgi:hypothetical protein